MRILVDILHLCSECRPSAPTTASLHSIIYIPDTNKFPYHLVHNLRNMRFDIPTAVGYVVRYFTKSAADSLQRSCRRFEEAPLIHLLF